MNMSIPLQVKPPEIENPANAMARILQLKGMQQEQSLNAMKAQEMQNSITRQNKMREILGQNFETPEARESALMQGGYLEEATKLGKDRRENAKNDAETGNKRVESAIKRIAMWRDTIGNVGDPRAAAALVVAMHGDPDLKDSPIARTPVDVWLKDLPDDPAKFEDWKKKFSLGATEFIKQNAPKTNVVNTGGSTQIVQTPGLGGAPQIAGTMQNSQSPDNAASVAATIRGQNMTDARARESAANSRGQFIETTNGFVLADPKTGGIRPVTGPDGQPLKGKAADRQMTDAQAKANLFGSRMQEADRILNSLEGKYNPMAVNAKMAAADLPGVGGAAGYAGNLMLSAAGQQAEQAQRDFINAVLRRESGAVISAPEFSNGQKQYFPQPGDTPEVLAQKRRNRQLAIQGMEAEVPGGFRGGMPHLTNPGGGAVDNDPLGIRGGR